MMADGSQQGSRGAGQRAGRTGAPGSTKKRWNTSLLRAPLSGMSGDTFSQSQPGFSISWLPSFHDTLKWDESRALGVLFPRGTGYVRCNPVEIKTYVLPLASAISHRALRWSEAREHTHIYICIYKSFAWAGGSQAICCQCVNINSM